MELPTSELECIDMLVEIQRNDKLQLYIRSSIIQGIITFEYEEYLRHE